MAKRENKELKEHKDYILNAIKEHRELQGDLCQITEVPDAGNILEVLLKGMGQCKIDVGFEIAFIDVGEESEIPYFSPQIGGNIFSNIPKENIPEVLKACNYINATLMSGFFGVMDGNLYYKNNLVIRSFFPDDVQIQLLADALLVGENAVNAVIDSFAFIGRGLDTLEDEIKAGRLN